MADEYVNDVLERSYVKHAKICIESDLEEKRMEMAKKILLEIDFVDKRKKELIEKLDGIKDLDFEDIYKSYAEDGSKRY